MKGTGLDPDGAYRT
jgi:hypothetical protein